MAARATQWWSDGAVLGGNDQVLLWGSRTVYSLRMNGTECVFKPIMNLDLPKAPRTRHAQGLRLE